MIKQGNNQRLLVLILIVCLLLGLSSMAYAQDGLESEELPSVQNQTNQNDIGEEKEEGPTRLQDKPELSVTEIAAGQAYDIKLINISESDYNYIIIKVWKDQDEEDCTLYPARWEEVDPEKDTEDDSVNVKKSEEKLSEPCFLAHIIMDQHNHPGTYQVVAYGVNETDDFEIDSEEDITLDMLSDKDISTEIEKTSFEVPDVDSQDAGSQDAELKDPISDSSNTLTPDSQQTQEKKELDEDVSPITRTVASAAPIKANSALLGIDVSHHNGSIDWAKVKSAGIKYVIIRCGYGDNYTSQDDKKWAYNVNQCEKLGIQYGVYIYSYATNTTMAKSEADHCIRLLKGHRPKYPVYLDLEDADQASLSNSTLKSITVTWATKIKSAGYTPGVYSSKNWWTNKLTSTDYNNYNKWVAQWNTSCTYKGIYHMWQYSSTGSVNGISGNVDMDFWYGSTPPITVGWNTIDGKKYYFDKNGAMLTGWQTIDGQRYYFEDDGAMVTGWQTIGGTQYYFNTSGEMVTGWENVHVQNATRVFGENRYKTSYQVADQLKKKLGNTQFSSIVLASGRNYPDALAGSYLSCMMEAPILLVDNSSQAQITELQSYIKNNLDADGKVYMLGGTGVLPLSLEKTLIASGYMVIRLGGADRYETNMKILTETAAMSSSNEIIICTGTGFADSLSAAALGKPILLVKSSLTDEQKEYLSSIKGTKTFCIIGGTGAVSNGIQAELTTYGTTTRIGGNDRYETSVNVAKKYFNKPASVILTYGRDFPDGLCGGVLASVIDGPLILAANGNSREAEAYTLTAGMTNGVALGGSALISDALVKAIFYMKDSATIGVR